MSSLIWVVTCVELGWDCVVGVFDNEMAADQCVASCPETYVKHEQTLKGSYNE